MNANWSQTIPATIDKPGKQVVVETFSIHEGSPVMLKIGLDTGERYAFSYPSVLQGIRWWERSYVACSYAAMR